MTSEEMPLKPCPFCGGKARRDIDPEEIGCRQCGFGFLAQTMQKLEKKWNTRADIVPDDKDVANIVESFEQTIEDATGIGETHAIFSCKGVQALIRAATAKRDCDGLVRALDEIRKSGFVSYVGEPPHVVAAKALAEYRAGKGE